MTIIKETIEIAKIEVSVGEYNQITWLNDTTPISEADIGKLSRAEHKHTLIHKDMDISG